jgi:threonine-phosphate decarboxylase
LNENKVIDCGSGICPLGPSKKVKAGIRKAVKSIRVCPDAELLRLRKLFSSKFGLEAGSVLFGTSLQELVYLIPCALMPKKILIAGPALNIYEKASSAVGAEISYMSGDEAAGFIIDTEAVRENLEGVDLFFIANPSRVTGRLTDRKELFETLIYASEKGVMTVVDESLIEFIDDDAFYNGISEMDNIIVLRTTACFYGLAGLELAYAVSSLSTISRLMSGKYSDVNTLAVEAAMTAFKDKTYRKLAKAYVHAERKLFIRSLNKIEGLHCHDSDSNMLLVKLKFPEEVFKSLAYEGFAWNDCRNISGLGSDFLSFSVMEHDKNLKFIRTLKMLFPGVLFQG